MKALVFHADGEILADVPDPVAADGELLLEVAFCGICGSDLHAAEPDFHDGVVMGHEFSAVVAGLGSGVDGWAVGDHVVVNPNGGWCRECPFCLAGEVTMCSGVWEQAAGLARPGGLAARVAVPAALVRRLPDNLPLRTAALVEPLAVALRAVNRSEAAPGDRVVVFGAGPIGLLVTAVLLGRGVADVTVVERSEQRRTIAARLGAAETVDPVAVDVVEQFADPVLAPRIAFDCAGAGDVEATAVRVLRPHGRLVVTGLSRTPPQYRAEDLVFKEIEIRGTFIYVDEFEEAIDLLASGTIDVEPLVSGVVDLDGAPEAFAAMRTNPTVVKYLIAPR